MGLLKFIKKVLEFGRGRQDRTRLACCTILNELTNTLSAWIVIELVAVEKAVGCHLKRTSGMDLIWICTPHWSRGPVNNYTRTWIFLNSRHLIVIENFEILDITDNNVLTAWIGFRDILKDWYLLLRFLQPNHTPIRVKIQLIMTYITHLQPRQLLADMHIIKEEEKA